MTTHRASSTSHAAFVGLGANVGDAVATLHAAIAAIAAMAGIQVTASSSIYRSAPLGFTEQPDFFNAVIGLATTLAATDLLHELHAIENRFGRERSFPNAPRTLDLDLLLYDECRIETAALRVPHPRMHERAFVLAPLLEIAPDVVIPGVGSAHAALAALGDQRIRRMTPASGV